MIQTRSYLVLSLIVGAAQLAGCAVDADKGQGDPSAIDPAVQVPADDGTEPGVCSLEQDPGATCQNHYTFTLDDANPGTDLPKNKSAACIPPDIYFHPNNGAHGGWIESWRLCYQGGGTYQICTGGSAPVRFWNPFACGGSVQDFYPQGWHGWAQTSGGCC